MENSKKDYLFRVGPLLFFPKDTEKKPPAYKDSFEEIRNIIRLAVILLYGFISASLITSLLNHEAIYRDLGNRPTGHYVVFLLPLWVCLIDVYLVWLERKTKIPMNRFSRYMIYGSWLVSALYYSIFIFNYLLFRN